MNPRARPHASRAGLTLIEIMVVVVIIAIGASAASLGLGSLTKASLQSACVRLVALTRYAYNRALTQGTTVRITFDLDQETFAVSEAHGRVTLVHSDAPLRKGDEQRDDKSTDEGAGIDPWEAARQRIEKPDVLKLPRSPFAALTAPSGKVMARFQTQPIGDDIRLAKIVVAHESKPREEGKADLFFFPSGLTQHAVVQVMDRNDIIYSVEIHPLTGRGKIHNAPFEPDVLLDDPNQRNEEASELEDRL